MTAEGVASVLRWRQKIYPDGSSAADGMPTAEKHRETPVAVQPVGKISEYVFLADAELSTDTMLGAPVLPCPHLHATATS